MAARLQTGFATVRYERPNRGLLCRLLVGFSPYLTDLLDMDQVYLIGESWHEPSFSLPQSEFAPGFYDLARKAETSALTDPRTACFHAR